MKHRIMTLKLMNPLKYFETNQIKYNITIKKHMVFHLFQPMGMFVGFCRQILLKIT